jgi:uncharacterized protein GlcG (DUF336 family)
MQTETQMRKQIHLTRRSPNYWRVTIDGIPLKREGKVVVGAIGVSGGSGDEDHAVATTGAAAF